MIKIDESNVDKIKRNDVIFCVARGRVVDIYMKCGRIAAVKVEYPTGSYTRLRDVLIEKYSAEFSSQPFVDYKPSGVNKITDKQYEAYIKGNWNILKEETMEIVVSKIANGLVLEVKGHNPEVGTFIANGVKEAESIFGKLIMKQLITEHKAAQPKVPKTLLD